MVPQKNQSLCHTLMCVLDLRLGLVDYVFHCLKGIAWPLKELEKKKIHYKGLLRGTSNPKTNIHINQEV
jgi:hypothetical protein